MKAFQAGMQKFQDSGAKVFAVSTDPGPSQKAWADSLGLTFPILSDFVDRKVAQEYGVLMPQNGFSKRVTFVIDKEGKINFIESGGDAMKILGAGDACDRLAHRTAEQK